jgi:parallel beta-helix repeat protein
MAGVLSRRARRSTRRTTRVKRTLSATVVLAMLVATIVAVGVAPSGAVTTTVVVGTGDVVPAPGAEWTSETAGGSMSFVNGPGTPPSGVGSLSFVVTAGQHRNFYNYSHCPGCGGNTVALSSITSMAYSTYRNASGSDANAVPAYQIQIDGDPGVVTSPDFTTLNWEPSDNGGTTVDNTWETWSNLENGLWWSTQPLPGFTVSGVAGERHTWSDIKAANPNAIIKFGFGPNIGTGPAFNGSIDKFVLGISGNDTVYNFEPTCSSTCYVATTGNDNNTGQASDPFLTVQKALNTVSSGGTVNIANGTYNIATTTTIPKSVTVNGASQAGTILDGPSLPAGSLNGLQITGTTPNVTIQNLTIRHFDRGIFTNGNQTDNLTIQNVTASDNTVHGIWIQANVGTGINGLTVDNVTASNNNAAGGLSGRGLWVINGPKANVSVTDSTFSNNGLVGLDISDGSVDGLDLSSNVVTGNGDSGIAAMDMKNATISGNTVTNNGRFGIEVKNTAGNGAETGAGFAKVVNNTVSRTIAATDARDYAGILVMKRGPVPPNPTEPSGVVIKGNSVSGIQRKPSGSTGDGFGIVVGGTGHVITMNTVTTSDVGVQIQGGNTANVQSTNFFDRDNATNGSAAVNRNSLSLTSNGEAYRAEGTGAATSLTCNWWGSNAPPPYAGGTPYLPSSNLSGACTGGVPIPTVSVGSISVIEGNSGQTPANVPVTLSSTYPLPVTVHYATANGNATTPNDYPKKTGTLTIPANTLSAPIPLTVAGGVVLEDNDFFVVTISSPTNATLGSPVTGSIIILNDELPKVLLKGGPSKEGVNTGFSIAFKQHYAYPLNLSVQTVNGTATAPVDFTAVNTNVLFPAQDIGPKTVSVQVKTDGVPEGAQKFSLRVTGGVKVVEVRSAIAKNNT